MRAVIGKNGTVSTVERQRMWLEELNRKHILYFGCHTGLGKTCQAELLAEKHYKVWRRIDAQNSRCTARSKSGWKQRENQKRSFALSIKCPI